jgi:hypothetical protein
VICFSVGCKELAERHLNVGLVDEQYQPLPQLLTDHLSQGVWRHCLFPRWSLGILESVTEGTEEITPEDDKLEGDDLADRNSLAHQLHQLDLESGTRRASVQIEQFSMKEREYGKGKFAFESYLAASLSRNHIVPTLWGYAEDD